MRMIPDPPKGYPTVQFRPFLVVGLADRKAAQKQDLVEMLPTMSVAEVIELVDSDMADLSDVQAAERVGKARKTILSLVKSESGKVYPVSKSRDQPDTDSNPFAMK